MSWLRFTMNLNDDPSSLEEIHDSYQTLVKGQLAIMEKDEAKNIYEATHRSKFCSVMQQHCTEELNFQRQKCFNCCLWSQDGKKCRFNRTLTSQ